METKTLKPHQIKSISLIRDALKDGKKKVGLQLLTGSGKNFYCQDYHCIFPDKQ